MEKCALIITGHIRNGFETQDWNNFIAELSKKYEVDLYIQTWEESEAITSWRKHELCKRFNIDEKIIKDYFKCQIKQIQIDNEYNVKIKGRFKGTVGLSPMPIRGWKKMICGMYLGVDLAKKTGIEYDFIIRSRFDYFTKFSTNHITPYYGPRKVTNEYLLEQIDKQNKSDACWLPECYAHDRKWCIDNFYFGDLNTIHKLLEFMSSEQIDILLKEKKHPYQEHYFVHAHEYLKSGYDLVFSTKAAM